MGVSKFSVLSGGTYLNIFGGYSPTLEVGLKFGRGPKVRADLGLPGELGIRWEDAGTGSLDPRQAARKHSLRGSLQCAVAQRLKGRGGGKESHLSAGGLPAGPRQRRETSPVGEEHDRQLLYGDSSRAQSRALLEEPAEVGPLLSGLYGWRNKGPERLTNLLRDTQLVNGRPWI